MKQVTVLKPKKDLNYVDIGPLAVPSIWESSIYRFVVPLERTTKEYFFDVTGSAVLTETKRELSETLDWALSLLPRRRNNEILDFGAGRLRNTLYLLNQGHNVTAVEFDRLFRHESSRQSLTNAQAFGTRFKRLIFPHQFFESNEQFDLILLINVLNVMPVPAERLLALQYCRTKLKPDGLILSFTQTSQSVYNGKPVFYDGVIGDESARYKTFFKDFSEMEIDELFASVGMRLKESKTVPHVRARTYKISCNNPLESFLSGTLIRQYVEGDVEYEEPEKVKPKIARITSNTKLNVPNPEELSTEAFYERALHAIERNPDDQETPRNRANNYIYQNIVGSIFALVFRNQLKTLQFETEINGGLGRIDITFGNKMERGFFRNISEVHGVSCPYIFIECKNLARDLMPNDFNQMLNRITLTKTHFGLITCRYNENRDRALARAREISRTATPNLLVGWLEDSDLIDLLHNRDDQEAIEEIMERRIRQITL